MRFAITLVPIGVFEAVDTAPTTTSTTTDTPFIDTPITIIIDLVTCPYFGTAAHCAFTNAPSIVYTGFDPGLASSASVPQALC